MSYDVSWANVSNAPFRLFKSFVHEGGISTPFLVHWPAGMHTTQHSECIKSDGRICHSQWVLMDIFATCCDLAGVPLIDGEGESFLPILHGNGRKRRKPIFWEHQGNRAVRTGQWKLVYRRFDHATECGIHGKDYDDICRWELYNMDEDRTELHNLASTNKEQVRHMALMWLEWARMVGVKPWPLKPLPEGEKDWSNLPWKW